MAPLPITASASQALGHPRPKKRALAFRLVPMDEDEAARRAAEHKAAALHRAGWEEGAGATIWARAVQDNLELHESARKRFAANDADL
jgi:hypothetical protein